jgi:hypothetical protein
MFSLSENKHTERPGNSPRPFMAHNWALCSLLVFITFTSFAGTNNSGTDSTKQKYETNDPRNPDCPCHKHQQQAEDEYHVILLKEHNYSTDPLEDLYEKSGQEDSKSSSFKTKNKSHFRMFRVRSGNHSARGHGIKKGKPHYGTCFRWGRK